MNEDESIEHWWTNDWMNQKGQLTGGGRNRLISKLSALHTTYSNTLIIISNFKSRNVQPTIITKEEQSSLLKQKKQYFQLSLI